MRLLRMPGRMEVLIPSVMALRETAMTAPLGQQGEPWVLPLVLPFGHTLPLHKGGLWVLPYRKEFPENASRPPGNPGAWIVLSFPAINP